MLAPPPPPPPPLPTGEMLNSPSKMANGDIPNMNGLVGIAAATNKTISPPKNILPPVHDSRTDLMKAIRDGNF